MFCLFVSNVGGAGGIALETRFFKVRRRGRFQFSFSRKIKFEEVEIKPVVILIALQKEIPLKREF